MIIKGCVARINVKYVFVSPQTLKLVYTKEIWIICVCMNVCVHVCFIEDLP